MSLYTNQIKTHIIDPVYFSQQRCEFKFAPDKLFMSNMRLLNVGYAGPSATAITHPAGVWGQIKNISLMDGGTSIDGQYDVGPLMAFKVANNPNDKNISKNKVLNRSYVGYASDSNITLDKQYGSIDVVSSTFLGNGWLSLLDVLNFLKKSIYVSSSMYKHLRLVIEFVDDRNAVQPSATSLLKPYLIVDEIVNEATYH